MGINRQYFDPLLDEINNMKNQLNNPKKKLLKIAQEINITKKISNKYWAGLRKKSKDAYEELRNIFTRWSKKNVTKFYNKELQQEIKRIKNIKFKLSKEIKYRQFKNSHRIKQSIEGIQNEIIGDYIISVDAGEKKLNRLMGLTQQINITEDQINKAITEGFAKEKSILGAKEKLKNEMIKDALDEKFITVINKNGKLMNFKIDSYAELVARTKMIEVQSTGTVNLALNYDSDLVQVSSHNTISPQCLPFEGKVFSISGKSKLFPPASDIPPYHPNCLHTLTVYFAEAQSEKELQKISDFSLGKTDIHPTRKSHIPISKIEERLKNEELSRMR